jgi:hypothetical protein
MADGRIGGDDLEALRGTLSGTVTGSGDPGWDEARRAWNLAVDQRPAAVAEVASAEEVAAAVRFATGHGLGVTAQPIGHGAIHTLEGVLLLRTGEMRQLDVDVEARTATVGPGTRWGEVAAATGPAGLAGLSGTAPGVSAVAYTLSGGIGWLARAHGIAANSVRSFEVVGPDGILRTVDAGTEPDLFWALRGGGGAFGIVTAMTFDLHPVPEVYGGLIVWPVERAREVLPAWRRWTGTLTDATTSIGLTLNVPPLPTAPPPLRGRSIVGVAFCHLGPADEGDKLAAALRELGDPIVDMLGPVPSDRISGILPGPTEPSPGLGTGALVHDLDDAALDAIADGAISGAFNPLIGVELRHLGGGVAEPGPGKGAAGHLTEQFLVASHAVAATPELAAAIPAALGQVDAAIEPVASGRLPLTFVDNGESVAKAFDEATTARLAEVKRRYDPDNRFRGNHPAGA